MAKRNPYPDAKKLLDFIDQSPSPWHATANMADQLRAAGYQPLDESAAWSLEPGSGYFVIRDESSLIAFQTGTAPPSSSGFSLLGAHTDSPGLRVKPNPTTESKKLIRIGVEVYGGPILATFADRDLGLAGRLVYRDQDQLATRLVRFPTPIMRIPSLAIHMDRQVNEQGLKLDKQTQIPPLLGAASDELPAQQQFRQLLADQAQLPRSDSQLGVKPV